MQQEIIREAQAIQQECERAQSEGRFFGEKEAAPYFARMGRLYLRAAGSLKRRQDAVTIGNPLYAALQSIRNTIDPKEEKLDALLGGAHGVAGVSFQFSIAGELSQSPAVREAMKGPEFRVARRERRLVHLRIGDMRGVFLYNAIHWGGLSNLLGEKNPFQRNLRAGQHYAAVSKDGRISVTPKFLEHLINHTPHYLGIGWRGRIPIQVSGEAQLSAGELFTLLRACSNSLHSLKLNRSLYEFGRTLESQRGIRQAYRRLASDRMCQSMGVRPAEEEQTVRDIAEQRFDAFKTRHCLTIAEAGRLPTSSVLQILTNYGVHEKGLKAGIEAAHPESRLAVNLSSKQTTVIDTGLGRTYLPFSKIRVGGRTSTPYQIRAAGIKRRIGERGAVTTLRFKRAA